MKLPFKIEIAPETKKKIIKSLQIASAGFFVGLIGILMADPRFIEWLSQHPIYSLAIATYLPMVLNALNEWRKNQDRLDNL